MSARFVSSNGLTVVDVVRLSLTPNRTDGEWLRVRRHGLLVAMIRSVPELVGLTDLSEAIRAVFGLWAARD
jgi:hypothetical protein